MKRELMLTAVVSTASALGAWYFTSCSDDKVVRQAEERAEQLDKNYRLLEEAQQQMKIINAAREDSIRRLTARNASIEQKVVELGRSSELMKKNLRVEVDDSIWNKFQPLINNYEDRLDMVTDQNKNLQVIIAVRERQLQDRDSIIDALNGLNRSLREEIGTLNKNLKQISSRSIVSKVIVAVAGAGVGYLIGSAR